MESLTLPAPAKLNLTLEVTEKLPNGYHAIRSAFVRLDAVSDTITVRVDRGGDGLRISADSHEIPLDAGNLCHQAAVRYLQVVRGVAHVDIAIRKVIPVSAGLGGGSSDAASVLLGLNTLFGNPLPLRNLSVIGSELGKDIPFFLTSAPAAVVTGMGERVEALPSFPPSFFLVANPRMAVPTKEAYEALGHHRSFMADGARSDVTGEMSAAIRSADRASIAALLYNDFESHVEARFPVVKQLKQCMRAFGAAGALMSGSGPTVFGVFHSRDQRLVAEQAIRRYFPSFLVLSA